MAWRPHPKRAATDPTSPSAWGTCARCGFVGNLRDLSWQFDYRGLELRNLNILVCQPCYDEPQRQLGGIILPPDPVGVLNARPEAYPSDEYWPRLLQNGAPRYLQSPTSQYQQVARSLQYSKYFS
jgi:hypothetical protein